ncbi:MAG: hypothetical protein JRF57_07360 [Deltaproteobacteria bacterium]|nr:hypothetical protein [Deltaproteobacteria bacterium]
MMNFWKWFFQGDTAPNSKYFEQSATKRPGILAYLDWWLVFHMSVGIILMFIVPVRINEAAKSILLPLAGIFIGLTFAWGGNAVSLMQSEEIDMLANYRSGGLKEYVFKFQSAILVLLITMIAWGLAGLNVFEPLRGKLPLDFAYNAIEVLLYFMISLSLRDCWHVVMGAQSMILLRSAVKKVLDSQKSSESSNKKMDSD